MLLKYSQACIRSLKKEKPPGSIRGGILPGDLVSEFSFRTSSRLRSRHRGVSQPGCRTRKHFRVAPDAGNIVAAAFPKVKSGKIIIWDQAGGRPIVPGCASEGSKRSNAANAEEHRERGKTEIADIWRNPVARLSGAALAPESRGRIPADCISVSALWRCKTHVIFSEFLSVFLFEFLHERHECVYTLLRESVVDRRTQPAD